LPSQTFGFKFSTQLFILLLESMALLSQVLLLALDLIQLDLPVCPGFLQFFRDQCLFIELAL
jgi:hypothetical protein